MAELPSLAEAFVVLVLVVPGFFAFMLVRLISAIGRKFSDLETTIWSLFGSIIVYVSYSLITGVTTIDAIRTNILLPTHLGLIVTLALLIGGILGGLIKFCFRRNVVLGSCWDIMASKMASKGGWAIVYTDSGQEYLGKVHYFGIGEEPKEITLRDPLLILRDGSWNVLDKIPMGKEVLFRDEDVKRILFFMEV